MKYSILSYNFNNYEPIREPKNIDRECEYIMVTDNKQLKSNHWKLVYLPDEFLNATGISKTLYVRYHPFNFVSCDTVLVLDGSMQINKSLRKYYTDFKKSNKDCAIGCWTSPIKSIDEMYKYWLNCRNYPTYNYIRNKAMVVCCNFLNAEVFHETGYMFFNKKPIVQDFLGTVWSALLKISPSKLDIDRLDQTVFNAILHKLYEQLTVMNLSRRIIQNDYITYCLHNTNKPLTVNINEQYEIKNEFYWGI